MRQVMYQSPCSKCHLRKQGRHGNFLLFAHTPTLATRLRDALNDCSIEFEENLGVFTFPGVVRRNEVSAALASRLDDLEKNDIRVGDSTTAGSVAAVPLEDFLRNLDLTWFDTALRGDRFCFHFAPIVDVAAGSIHAFECLVRLFLDRTYFGAEIVNAAVRRNSIHAFDAYCRTKAVHEAARAIPNGTRIFINFMPESIFDPENCLRSTVDAVRSTGFDPANVVFEAVEAECIDNTAHLGRLRDFFRRHGFGFALDDVGMSASSFQMLCDIQPDYVKLNRELLTGLGNPMRRHFVRKIVELGRDFNVQVIARAVEDDDMVNHLLDAGVSLMQGKYFGRSAATVSHFQYEPRAVPQLAG